jgi:Na+/alanine symporter
MSVFEQTIDAINGLVWGPIMLTLLLGTGIFSNHWFTWHDHYPNSLCIQTAFKRSKS